MTSGEVDTTPGPAVELIGVTKRYGGAVVVDGLSLQIPRGSTFGLIGPNGAGKSTTIKMLMGMLPVTAGTVHVLGIDPFAEPSRVKQRVGYVPEVHHVYRWMRVGEVIGFVKALYHTWNDDLSASLLDLFALDPRKRVKHLSKGMLAKLSLLLAIAHEPELLVLDEPMSGLDPIVREELLDGVLRSICRREQTVLFSSHTLDDVRRLADTVGILYEGQLLVHKNVDDLLSSSRRIRAVLRDGCLPRREPAGTIWQDIQRREWSLTVTDFSPEAVLSVQRDNCLEHVEVHPLSLEELFKDYVKGRRAPR